MTTILSPWLSLLYRWGKWVLGYMIYLRSHSWKVGEMDYRQQSPNFEPPATAPDPCHLAKDGAGKEGALCQALWVWKSSPLNLFYWGSEGLQTWMSEPSSVLVQALADWQELIACVSSQLFIHWHHTDCLKSAIVGVFTPWKSASAANQGLFYSTD